ncbi:nucleoside hydrolase [Ectobacillus antri]|jgi:purine nucleosidase|uniref:nucleoside hydrolase n=1 Tax=Ectobacillus antri TaxID=2486280 RepID=UPI000F59F3CC|nr:nucleoside hydrolase [Ectobacillus antri]
MKKKVLLFCDPGIDDSLAIIYALLHPDIELVGLVTSYGNVSREQTTANAAYLLSLIGREDIPVIRGAYRPFSGESNVYYPEIHGENGMGPIQPPKSFLQASTFSMGKVIDIMDEHKNELIMVDVGRSTTLAIVCNIGEERMEQIQGYYIMGGAFFVPGNVTPVAEANFYGDPVASNYIMMHAKNVTLCPLNVTKDALITETIIEEIAAVSQNPFRNLIKDIFMYYYQAYQKLIPKITGTPLHDVLTVMVVANPELLHYVYRPVSVATEGVSRGESIADFRALPHTNGNWVKIGWELNQNLFVERFKQIMISAVAMN